MAYVGPNERARQIVETYSSRIGAAHIERALIEAIAAEIGIAELQAADRSRQHTEQTTLHAALNLPAAEQYRLAFLIAENIGCAVTKPKTRDEIIGLIREHYDPEPKDWPRHRVWDDGAGDIADKIIAGFQQTGANASQTVETCAKCGLKADSMLHRFCTHKDCPAGALAVSRPNGETP